MKINPESLKKIILIGLSLFAYKTVLLVFAYVLDSQQYNAFNQAYYTASIIILFGSLGFNISQTRIPIKTSLIFFFVSINVIITFSILHLLSKPFDNYADVVPIIIYSIFISVGTIMNFRLLFEGSYKKHVLIILLLTLAHLIVLPAAEYLNINIFTLLSITAVIWFISVYFLFNKSSDSSAGKIEYYKIGFSAFVINSAVSLGLAADKFIANHYFSTETANSYTFAWGITAPVFYIGNLIEKYLFAEKKPDKSVFLKKGFLISITLIAAYIAGILSIVNFFPSILPASISKELFYEIFTFMILGYGLYVILHFPINAYLFKALNVKKQKIISIYFTLIISAAVFAFYYIINSESVISYKMLLLFVWLYIFILLTVKAVIMFTGKNGEVKEDAILVQDNIQEIP